MSNSANEFLQSVIAKNPAEKEFHQAVREVVDSVKPVLDRNPEYRQQAVLERITEPERVVMFRVPWIVTGPEDAYRLLKAATDLAEEIINLHCAACPIFNHKLEPIASIWITGPSGWAWCSGTVT